jgi:predicted O-linked N-acetylglucosamine transferase (SPINDLY family)
MDIINSLSITQNSQPQASQFLIEERYSEAAQLYEQEISTNPENKSSYWYLGLIFLLQGEEAEAQTTWLLGIADEDEEALENHTQELIHILSQEADRRKEKEDYSLAWVIRQHIREIHPFDINNRLHLLGLSTLFGEYDGSEPVELELIELFNSPAKYSIDIDLLTLVLTSVLYKAPYHEISYDLTKASLEAVNPEISSLVKAIKVFVSDIAALTRKFSVSLQFTELCLQFSPDDPDLINLLSHFYQDNGEFDKGIETAKACYSKIEGLVGKVNANFMLMRALMSAGGHWNEFCEIMECHRDLLKAWIQDQQTAEIVSTFAPSVNTTFFLPYCQDRPQENLELRSQVARIWQQSIEKTHSEKVQVLRQQFSVSQTKKASDRLKIGYISHCFRSHSVGWLSRWLFKHHDRDQFELYAYVLHSNPGRYKMQEWFMNQVHKAHRLKTSAIEAVEKIYEDEIDILVDLDSHTLVTTCEVMALKAAPVQVTWLGWDASALPAIDYYIADPYVLPENAQDYYPEKIWRLPQTYIAVDGFETAVPTLRRDQLDIPSDAVIYFSGQRGYKYNPNTLRLQIQIIKAVPNSYFLLKGVGDENSLKNFFIQIAEEEGITAKRLRFLPTVRSEEEHRANLGIVDVVLDTYPYNGATTTMETLWMEIPMVTRVGQQFAARNSYTMMMNAGITEGIAWTDEEYVEWGIRLGTDESLRQQVAWKLRKSKQTAPLWNGKQFTREMEKAYQQMWQIYLDGKG